MQANSGSILLARFITVLFLTLGLSACSSSKSGNHEQKSDDSISLTGVVAKGIIINGLVHLCLTPNCDGENDPVDRTTTQADGSYRIDVSKFANKVLTVRLLSQINSKMLCDAQNGCGNGSAFGDEIPLEEDFSMRSVVVVDGSATEKSGHITPLTELVTAAAEQSGGGAITPDAVNKGSQAVKKLLGLDANTNILETKPLDLTKANSDLSNSKAVMLSALSAAFADTNGIAGNSMQERLENIAKAIKGQSATQADLTAMIASAKKVITQVAATNPSLGADQQQNLTSQLEQVEAEAEKNCANNTCGVVVESSNNESHGDFVKGANMRAVLSLVNDVRLFTHALYRGNTPVYTQLDDLQNMANADLEYTAQAIGAVTEAMLNAYQNNAEAGSLAPYHHAQGTIVGVFGRNDQGTRFQSDHSITFELPGKMPVKVELVLNLNAASETEASATLAGNVSAKAEYGANTKIEFTNAELTAQQSGASTYGDVKESHLQSVQFQCAATGKNSNCQSSVNNNERTFNGSLALSIQLLRMSEQYQDDGLRVSGLVLDGQFDGPQGLLNAQLILNPSQMDLFAAKLSDTPENFFKGWVSLLVRGVSVAEGVDADITAKFERTEFNQAQFTIAFEQSERVLTVAVLADQNTGGLESIFKSRSFEFGDANGTSFTFNENQPFTGNEYGYIKKDETIYATIIKDDTFWIDYHFDQEGNRLENKKHYETLF